jgi:uncharacterized protein YbcC (UPF0753/DUF2309 family)
MYLEALKINTNRITPLWPLKNFVAVNPYFGLNDMPIEDAHHYLGKVCGSYLFKSKNDPAIHALNTVSKFYAKQENTAWDLCCLDYVSGWCAAYFDENQAFLRVSKAKSDSLYTQFINDLQIDKTLAIMGLKNIKEIVSSLPQSYMDALDVILNEFKIESDVLPLYLHALTFQYKGWASLIRQKVWEDELHQKPNALFNEFQVCLLTLDYVIWKQLPQNVQHTWHQTLHQAARLPKSEHVSALHQSQIEYEKKQQSLLFQKLNSAQIQETPSPKIQAIFCIDVRSEIFRNHLERTNPTIETIGFAGFFGAAFQFESLSGDHHTEQYPVLLTGSHTIKETLGSEQKDRQAAEKLTLLKEVKRALKHFKLAAISCFSFMGPVGVFYLPLTLKRVFWGKPLQATKSAPQKWKKDPITLSLKKKKTCGISIEDQITLAHQALNALSLSEFSPLVVIVGHESVSQNNPFESALDCGACGGHSGQKNAQAMVDIFNTPEVRHGLIEKGVKIPKDTHFIAAIHNTTTDQITIFKESEVPKTHQNLLKTFKENCAIATHNARIQRSKRLNISKGDLHQDILFRSQDWAQVRPEWGLAGCNAFIAAPRAFTRTLPLDGRAFLHSYNWKQDPSFAVLELILTAPVVVASWINLQYYASVMDNSVFGSGNKVLHNVVAGLGVLEGSYGDIQLGLPMQSVHDGHNWQHSLERLNVIVAAPQDAINAIIQKHTLLKNLFENKWMHLFLMNDDGQVTHQYDQNGQWTLLD